MANPVPVARVVTVEGEVYARGEDGSQRLLRAGDFVYEGETIVSGANGAIDLAGMDGQQAQHMVLGANEVLVLDTEVLAQIEPDVTPSAAEAALQLDSGESERIVRALAQDQNIDELIEDTAAGAAGTGAGGGPTFVRLLRISESVDPSSYTFGAPSSGDVFDVINGGNGADVPASPSIVVDDGNGVTDGEATVFERGLVDAGDSSETTSGVITVRAPGGLLSLVVAGTTFDAAQLAALATSPQSIDTGVGTLTLTGYNAGSGALSYTYTLNAAVSQPGLEQSTDSIALTVTSLGGTASGTLTVTIVDSVPVAQADTNTVTEDASNTVNGNVFGNDALGADANATPVTPASIALAYGTLVLNADGSYSYTLDNSNPQVNALKDGETLTDTYTYTLTDGDGDSSTATLSITINGHTDGTPSIVPEDGNGPAAGQATVYEQGLTSSTDTSETTSGTITIKSPDGLASVEIGGTTLTAAQLAALSATSSQSIDTGEGTLTLTGYDAASGALSYTYTLKAALNQPGATETSDAIALKVTDLGGESTSGTLTIGIVDSMPVAHADVNTVTEDGADQTGYEDGNAATTVVGGNVITTGAGADTLGADATTVTGVTFGGTAGTVGSALAGAYGTLVLNADGSYSYTLDNSKATVQALNAGETTTETFTYTITDADGDASTTTLTITLIGSDDGVVLDIPDVNGTADGQLSVQEDQTKTGSFTLSAPDGLDPSAALTIAGTDVSKAALEASSTTPVSIATDKGTLTLTGYDAAPGSVSYRYDPTGTSMDHSHGEILDAISIVVRDDGGETTSGTLSINITDTEPVAHADVNTVTEDGADQTGYDDGNAATTVVGGNVITTGAGADTLGADATTVTGVTFGGTAGTVGSALAGAYGTLVLNADGSYSYTLDNSKATVQALNAGETTTEEFTYTITDADGDASTTTLTITLIGSDDGVVLDIPDVNGTADGQLSVQEDQTKTGSFTLSAPDGLDPSAALTIAGTDVSKAALEASGTTPVSIATDKGTLTLTGYDAATGTVSYRYDPTGTSMDHSHGEILDAISIVVRDDGGETTSGILSINITDTEPVAHADVNTVTEDGADQTGYEDGNAATTVVGGNVITTGAGADTLGADATTVTGVTFGGTAGTVGSALAGAYGTLVLNADGSYSYTLDNSKATVQALNAGETTTEEFTYTITDSDGDASTTTLTITLIGSDDGVVLDIPDVNGTADGQLSVQEDQTKTGSFTLSAPDGLDPSAALTIAGTDVSKAALEASSTTPVSIATDKGTLTLTGYDAATGSVSYRYDPTGTSMDHSHGEILDAISIVVRDDGGETTSGTLSINITDTEPVAHADVNTVTEDGADQTGYEDGNAATTVVGGNVITTGAGADTLGADATTVTGVTFGGTAGTVGSALAGAYGTLVLNADGSYTYTLDNSKATVQALARNQQVTEQFSYTITDADGDASTTTLTVTVGGSNDAPEISVRSGDSDVAALEETDAGLSTGGTLSIFDVDTTDTVAATQAGTLNIGGNYAGTLPSGLTQAVLLAMFSVSGGESSATAQDSPHGIVWSFNSGSQAFDFVPEGKTLTLTYTVLATDSFGATDTHLVTITITGTNDGIVLNNDTATLYEDGTVSGNVLANDVLDPDYGEATVVNSFTVAGMSGSFSVGAPTSILSPSGEVIGSFTLNSDGSYVFTPVANYSGAVPVITYGASSPTNSGSATLSITVTPVADAPGVTADAGTVNTVEDTAITLGFNAPTVSDATDLNGNDGTDNPERLSLVSLSGIPAGVQLLAADGSVLYTSTGAAITILLSDAGNLIASPGTASIAMTTAQFESLRVLPAADDARNFTVTMSVTSYEVDASANPLNGIAGATSSTAVLVDVLAVTDTPDLMIGGSDGSFAATIDEDNPLNLTALLSATFRDLDGSEQRSITISNPAGNATIYVNGVAVPAGSSYTIAATAAGNDLETSESGFPAISITADANFSGDIKQVQVTLSATDTDGDSVGSIATLSDSVFLDLFINPVAGDVAMPGVSTPEDTAVRIFPAAGVLTDLDGSEKIDGIVINDIPAGWVLKDGAGTTLLVGDGVADYSVSATAIADGSYVNYTLTPPAQSSQDITLSVAVTTTDTEAVNGVTQTVTTTVTLSPTIAVTPVAEQIGVDSDGNGTTDLTMSDSHTYATAGQEDTWFNLSEAAYDPTDGQFNLQEGWFNADADGSEKTYALLTPSMNGSPAIGAQFKYIDADGVEQVVTYVGTPIQVPMEYLSTLQFLAPANEAGTFSIKVQALTVDTDPDTGAQNTATSGEAYLTNILIQPVADAVTLAITAPVVGKEDTAIPLSIRPTSVDSSEYFRVTLSGIPDGATITYGGTVLTVSGGQVTIDHFDASLSLTITPPLNSNVDFDLTVSAVSVDVLGSVISTSDAATLPLHIDVRGVADAVNLVVHDVQTTEATVDGNGGKIALAQVLGSAASADTDGSETVNLVITGLPEGVSITGLAFMGGTGESRTWSGTAAAVQAAQLVIDQANFSGTIELSIRAVSTENDGNSWSGTSQTVAIEVTPTPEATLTTQTTLLEDTLTKVDFGVVYQNGDSNETLASVWIKADSLAEVTLYLGTTPLAAAAAAGTVVLEDGWYKLTAEQAGNVYAQGAANSDANGSFTIRYAITDPSSDGSLPSVTTQSGDTEYKLDVVAVTDATETSNSYVAPAEPITTRDPIDVTVSVTQANDSDGQDVDGSEKLLYYVIDGVPLGVIVANATYVGDTESGNSGRWILYVSSAAAFDSATLSETIRFEIVGKAEDVSYLDKTITITAYSQDTDADGASTALASSSTTWTLQTGQITETGGGGDLATIEEWEPITVSMTEDTARPLADLLNAEISGSSSFSITLTGLPAGSVVSGPGVMHTVIDGEDVWTVSGSGDNAALQSLLASITVTPPADWNDNNHADFGFDATLTTYNYSGEHEAATVTVEPPITPVSDPVTIVASDVDVAEDNSATITLDLSNPNDGSNAHIVGGTLYFKLDESGMETSGGTLSLNGSELVKQAVSGVAGVPDGDYYVISGVDTGSSLSLVYTPVANASGTVSYEALVQSQEDGASNVATGVGSGSLEVTPVNDGVDLTATSAGGKEDHAIPLDITITSLDASESVSSILLHNVPTGFLVMVGSSSADAVLASNLGEGNWGLSTDGTLPAYVALVPTVNWSGTLTDLQVGVWSGEASLDPTETSVTLSPLTVAGVADGITFTPTLSFGDEGDIVRLNLNSVMNDQDGSETATLTIKGLGDHAAFYANDTLLAASYNSATDTYTLSDLSADQVGALGVIQKGGSYSVTVTGYTTDSPGGDESSTSSNSFTLQLAEVLATTGDDTLLYDGTALNGLGGTDTVQLRLGESLVYSNLDNIERIDLGPSGDHALSNLRVQDVLDMTDSGKTLTILGDTGDSVTLANGSSGTGAQWTQAGSQTIEGHTFDVYTNAYDSAVKVLIEQSINKTVVDP